MLFHCRDVLPFTLKLPETISAAKTTTDLEEVAKLGIGKWPFFLSFLFSYLWICFSVKLVSNVLVP